MIRDRHQLTPDFSTLGQLWAFMREVGLFMFLITLLAIPVLQPLFSTKNSCGFDTMFHLWRSVQAGELLQAGVLYSRWAPQMAHGYGYPLFLFQSPLTAQATAVFHQFGLSWPVALNLMYGLGIVASGWTMWWLARTFWGNLGGLVAAVAYLYAPFHAYVAFYRASLSETVAWSLPPLLLWGIYRWQKDRSRWGLVTAVFSFILLMLTHDVTAYAFMPLFVGWILLWGINGRFDRLKADRSWAKLWRGVIALLLGIGGSTFFWLPAIAERNAIQFGRANSAWPFLYFNNFLPPDQLLALPRSADPGLLNDWPPRALGGLLLAFALLGVLLAWRHSGWRRWLAGFLLLGLVGYVFLAISLSEPLWTAVPQLAAFQFPWRFLAPASFLAAFLCGAVGHREAQREDGESQRKMRGMVVPILAVGLLSVAHWGWLFPDHCAVPDDLSVSGMVGWEMATKTVGSTASGELLPLGVEIVPEPANPPAWDARLDTSVLPPNTKLLTTNHKPLTTIIELETAVPFQATIRIFNFPGWRVMINDEPVEITTSDPQGWITFPVGNGRSTIEATFSETPLRLAADGLSLFSLLLLLGLIGKSGRFSVFSIQYSVHRPLTTDYWPLITLALLLLGGKLLVDQQQTPLRQPRLQNGSLLGVAQPMNVTLGTPGNMAQVRLLGLDDWETAVAADDPLILTLYWQANQPLTENYKVGLTLLDENDIRWSVKGLRDYRWLRNPPPTTAWPSDQYALTAFFVDTLPGTPPGNYRLTLSFFEQETLVPLTFYDANGQSLGPQLELGRVTVQPSNQPWPTTLEMQHRLNFSNGDVTLLGSNVDREEAAPGDPTLVTLFWATPNETQGHLSLLNEAGD
ncbi:MAG: YfhO family protein, partial [Chloroflexi bacterium]|nr:YfhO family protein [Chloroflexota bacterium]